MTKKIDSYQAQNKEYTGTLVLGKTTPSLDLETEFDGEYPTDHITNELILAVCEQLSGTIQQIPPMFSAIQVNGKRLYELARKGIEVEVKSREVTINSFEIDASNFPEIGFTINCSKGTYIRSLVRDFGKLCNSGAYMATLRRTKIGEYNVDNALTIEQFVESVKTATILK